MKSKIILLGLIIVLSGCVTQTFIPVNTSIPSPSVSVNSIPSITPSTSSVPLPTGLPTAYPLPENTNMNKKIIYASNHEGTINLYSINSDGTDNRKLSLITNRPENSNHFLSVTPDGTKVVFTSDENGSSLNEINIDGSNKNKIFDRGTILGLNMSRDGNMIVSSRNNKIVIYNILTEEKKEFNIEGFLPSFSPDGKKIVFTNTIDPERKNDFTYQLFVMNTDGTELKQIFNEKKKVYNNPKWAPNGTKIIVQYNDIENQKGGIYSINIDGSDLRFITDKTSSEGIIISPDGTKIAYNSLNNTNTLNIADIDGNNEKVLYQSKKIGSLSSINWSPDSKRILFYEDGFNILDIDGTNLKNFNPLVIQSSINPYLIAAW